MEDNNLLSQSSKNTLQNSPQRGEIDASDAEMKEAPVSPKFQVAPAHESKLSSSPPSRIIVAMDPPSISGESSTPPRKRGASSSGAMSPSESTQASPKNDPAKITPTNGSNLTSLSASVNLGSNDEDPVASPGPLALPAAEQFTPMALERTSAESAHTTAPSADGKVLIHERRIDDVQEALMASPSMSDISRDQHLSVKDSGGFLYPTNTIVASNGEVYHVEPFQLPPPNEIASLMVELRERRGRADSNVSERDRSYSLSSERGGRDQGFSNSLVAPFGSVQQVRRRNNSGKGGAGSGPGSIPSPAEWAALSVDTAVKRGGGAGGQGPSSPDRACPSSPGPSQGAATRNPNKFKADPEYFDLDSFTVGSYLNVEVLGRGEPGLVGEKAVDSIQNFLAVPLRLERFLGFGWVICMDNFLYVLTFLPVRFIMSLCLLAQWLLDLMPKFTHPPRLIPSSAGEMHRTHVYDLMRGTLVIVGFFTLTWLNMSRVYHYVRQQSTIKLYVLTGMLEIFDKLLCSFGQDTFDLLYWHIRHTPTWRDLSFSFSLVCVYIAIHSVMYFLLVATLTVAINSADQAMIAVLVLNNFAEIKSFVFKKFDKQNLFQLACADVTERFNLTLFMSTILLVGAVQAGDLWREHVVDFMNPIMWMIGCEAGADWIKHAFITKFNHLDASVYDDYFRLLRKDVLDCRRDKAMLDRTYAITRRVGLSQIPLTCTFLRYMWLIVRSPGTEQYCRDVGVPWVVFGGGCFMGTLMMLKVATGISLVRIAAKSSNRELQAYYNKPRKPNSRNKEVQASIGKLMNIERYTIHKGRVVG